MFSKSLLLLAFSIASYDCALIPDLTNAGNVGFRMEPERRNAQFGEGVRDWFKNMRDKLFGRESSNQVNLPNPLDLNTESALRLYKNNEAPERLIIQPGNFFLDLSNLRFDPNKDWGFHIGNWYVIRKSEVPDESYSRKSIEDWSRWNDFVDLRKTDERSDEANAKGGQNGRGVFYSTTTVAPLNVETTSKGSSDENTDDANENGGGGMDDLSVEVLKPPA